MIISRRERFNLTLAFRDKDFGLCGEHGEGEDERR